MDLLKKNTFKKVDAFYEGNQIGSGELSFGGDGFPRLCFKEYETMESNILLDFVLVIDTDSKKEFTLINCKIYWHMNMYIYANSIATGSINESTKFKRIEIEYSDISERYMPFKIDVTVNKENNQFRLISEYLCDLDRSWLELELKSKSYEYILFCFEHMASGFEYSDIEKKVKELAVLFSVLFDYPVCVEKIAVISEKNKIHYVLPSYFTKANKKNKEEFSWAACFAYKGACKDKWQIIFDNYYKSEFREISWSRLASMLHYSDFWEFSVMGYMTILDNYISQRVKNIEKEDEQIKSFKQKIKKLNLSTKQTEDIVEAIYNSLKTKYYPSFMEKYNAVMEKTNDEVKKIINLDEDIKILKKLRDNIAHGKKYYLPDNISFTDIELMKYKIILLLTYFAFIDFGLTDDDFFKCFNLLNRLVINPNLDKESIDRYIKK